MEPAKKTLLLQLIQQLTPLRILLIAVLLLLPGLLAPFYADDYFHLLLLSDHPLLQRGGDGSLFGLFSFVDDNPEHRAQMLRYGVLPWWTADGFHFRFWRPLAEATHWLDYQLLPGMAWFAHLHSLFWFVLLLIVFQRLGNHLSNDKAVLLIALAVFTWDGQHVATINWVANRSALIAAVLAFSALYQHMRWRCGETSSPVLALVLFIYALLSSESAISIVIYLFFHAVLLDRRGWRAGLLAITPYLLIAVIYLGFYVEQGFGADTSSDFYVSPWHDPVQFSMLLLQRFFAYFAAAWLPLPAGMSWIGGETYPWLSQLMLWVGVALFAVVFTALYRKAESDRQLLFWLLSATFSVLPVCAAMPQDRLALFQTAGMAFVIALLIGRALSAGRPIHLLVKLLAVIHLLLSPMHLLAGSLLMQRDASAALHSAVTADYAGRHVIVLSMPLGLSVAQVGTRAAVGQPLPLSFLPLASEEGEFHVKRLDERNFRISRDIGFVAGFEKQFRSLDEQPFSAGDQIELAAAVITVEILTAEGRPADIRLTLTQPLADYELISDHPEFILQR